MLGGTFDHMHSGHRLLLTQAALLTKSRMVIGLSSDELLKAKKYAEVLEPFETRATNLKEFLARFSNLQIEIHALNDPVGPAGTDPNLQAIILTQEVAKGGKMVDEIRQANGLEPLKHVLADMILVSKDEEGSKFSNKMSSTLIREHLANL